MTTRRQKDSRRFRGHGRSAAFVLALAVAASVGWVLAVEPPHWTGTATILDCTTPCHVIHNAQGAALTSSASNVNLCQSCHNSTNLPITNSDVAVPGSGGTSHAFDVAAVNLALDTQVPLDRQMELRVMDDDIVCSTCHNQHKAEAAFGGESRIGTADKVVAAGGTGTLSAGGEFTGAAGLWYLVDITLPGNESGARFRYSKDSGISWTPVDCTPAATVTCLTANPSGVTLDNGVQVTFSGLPGSSFQVGEQWEFYASWPFLRRTTPLTHGSDGLIDAGDNATGDDFCRDCHRSWVMTHTDVQTWDDTYKSHPVGVALNANSQGYDRADPLDGDGVAQNSAGPADVDGNPSNDLRLDQFGNVQCLSCHGVHYADSNTQTPDGP
jgi:hypothetical protein